MPKSQRPARTYVTDPVTRAVRILALLVTAAIAGWLLLRYPSLPQVVPTHFDASGTADGWGDKSSVLLLIAVFLALSVGIAWLSTKPRVFNYPVQVTASNAQPVYREGERMLVWLLVPMSALFAGISGSQASLPAAPLLWAGMAGMLIVIAVGIVRLLRAS